jgi:chromosome segregation ATPase
MAKNYKTVILIALSICAAILMFFNYIASQKEKHDLVISLNQANEQVAVLENDKQNLSQALEKERQIEQKLTEENSKLQADLKAGEEKLAKFDTDLAQAKAAIEELNMQLSALKAENTGLVEEKNNLNAQLTEKTQENESMKARLGSFAELKKAIRELKQQMRNVGRAIIQKVMIKENVEGNRGFLVKDGKSTYPARVKIEVKPLPAND